VKVKGQRVIKNRQFDADDDWLRDLTITVKNVSGKRILYASIDLLFSSREPNSPHAFDEAESGNRQLLLRPPTLNELSVGIEPEQEININVRGVGYDRVRALLADVGCDASRLKIRVGKAIFVDDTVWYAGSHFLRDNTESRTWKNVDKPKARDAQATASLARTGEAPLFARWNSYARPDSSLPLDDFLLQATYRTSAVQSSNCYRIVNSQNVWCNLQPGCNHVKDYTDMMAGSYVIQSWPTSCVDSVGDWCGTDTNTIRIPCVGGGGGGGGGSHEGGGGSCYDDWDCDFGYYCNEFSECEEDLDD
jgi:hypothetical protein